MAAFLDFDPDKWSLSRGLDPDSGEPAKVANPAKVEPALAALATLAGLRRLPNVLRHSVNEAVCC